MLFQSVTLSFQHSIWQFNYIIVHKKISNVYNTRHPFLFGNYSISITMLYENKSHSTESP